MKPRMSGIADDARGDDGDRECVERLHVALEAGLLAGREIEVVDAELAGLGEQRVVDVGDVADTAHRVAQVDQAALQHVVGDERRRMAEVRGVVRRDPARVHQHVVVRLERHDRPPRRVVELHRRSRARHSCGGVNSAGVAFDSRELRGDPRLVAHVELQQHRGERLDRRGVGQFAGIERPATGDAGDDVADGLRPPPDRRRRSARRSRSARRCGRVRSPAGGGTRRRRGTCGTAACTWAATLPRGGTSGWNSLFTRTSALAIETTTLPASASSFSCAVPAAESHGVAITISSQSAAAALSPCVEQVGELWPLADQFVDGFHRPVLRSGTDDDVVADAGQPRGEAAACWAGSAENSDAHGDSVAHRRVDPLQGTADIVDG